MEKEDRREAWYDRPRPDRYGRLDDKRIDRRRARDSPDSESYRSKDKRPTEERSNLVTLPRLSKFERRQLFAMKVAKEEEERLRRQQQESWQEHEARCLALGIDPHTTATVDPQTGYPLFFNPALGQWQPYAMQGKNFIIYPLFFPPEVKRRSRILEFPLFRTFLPLKVKSRSLKSLNFRYFTLFCRSRSNEGHGSWNFRRKLLFIIAASLFSAQGSNEGSKTLNFRYFALFCCSRSNEGREFLDFANQLLFFSIQTVKFRLSALRCTELQAYLRKFRPGCHNRLYTPRASRNRP